MKAWTMDDYNQAMEERRQQRPTLWGGWKLKKNTCTLVYDGGFGYPLDLERFTNPVEVLDMIAQVEQKTWATDACLAGLVRALNDILKLQQNLCGSGVSKTLTQPEVRKLVKAS